MTFLYGLETGGEKSISLIRRCAFHRSTLLHFASLQKRSLRQETRAAMLTRALLRFNGVGDHDPFSFSFPWFSSHRLVSAQVHRQANVGDGNQPPPFLLFFPFSLLSLFPSLLFFSSVVVAVVVSTFVAQKRAVKATRERVCTEAEEARRSLPAAKGLTTTERSVSAIRKFLWADHCSSS